MRRTAGCAVTAGELVGRGIESGIRNQFGLDLDRPGTVGGGDAVDLDLCLGRVNRPVQFGGPRWAPLRLVDVKCIDCIQIRGTQIEDSRFIRSKSRNGDTSTIRTVAENLLAPEAPSAGHPLVVAPEVEYLRYRSWYTQSGSIVEGWGCFLMVNG